MTEYLIVVEKANGNFSAYCPDLPGFIATGTTREETEANMREAVRMHLDGLRAGGQPLPEPSATASRIAV